MSLLPYQYRGVIVFLINRLQENVCGLLEKCCRFSCACASDSVADPKIAIPMKACAPGQVGATWRALWYFAFLRVDFWKLFLSLLCKCRSRESWPNDGKRAPEPVRRRCSLFFWFSRAGTEEDPFFRFHPIISHLLMDVKITICFYVPGTYGSPVFVRAYWRRRNGRKEFVRAHWRHSRWVQTTELIYYEARLGAIFERRWLF